MRGHRGYNICPWLKTGKNEICGKSCREEYCKAHRDIDKKRKSNSKTLFKLWHWDKEPDTTMPRLWARKRKAKNKEKKFVAAPKPN